MSLFKKLCALGRCLFQQPLKQPLCLFAFILPLQVFSIGESSIRVILSPKQEAMLASKIVSEVVDLPKEMGDSFKKGELLVGLDDTAFAANVSKTETILERARVEYEAKQQLYSDGSISLSELTQAKADLAAAEADNVNAQDQLDACHIIAPFDGRIVNLYVNKYETVQPNRALIELVDDNVLYAQFLVPSKNLQNIRVGELVNIKVIETDTIISSEISHISPVIDPSSSLIKVFSTVENGLGLLRSGMKGYAYIEGVH